MDSLFVLIVFGRVVCNQHKAACRRFKSDSIRAFLTVLLFVCSSYCFISLCSSVYIISFLYMSMTSGGGQNKSKEISHLKRKISFVITHFYKNTLQATNKMKGFLSKSKVLYLVHKQKSYYYLLAHYYYSTLF